MHHIIYSIVTLFILTAATSLQILVKDGNYSRAFRLYAISNAVCSCGDIYEQLLLGDVVISVETATRQAKERGHSLLDELRILLVIS